MKEINAGKRASSLHVKARQALGCSLYTLHAFLEFSSSASYSRRDTMALSLKQLSEFGPYCGRQKAVGSPDLCTPGTVQKSNEDCFAYPCNQPQSCMARMGATGFLGKQAVLRKLRIGSNLVTSLLKTKCNSPACSLI